MKFYAVTASAPDGAAVQEEYKNAREIGVVRIGGNHFFFRKGRKVYYIPYSDIRRCFRRVMLVPAKMCCGKGDLAVENLVIYGDEGELAQIQLPGTRAAKELVEILKGKMPDAEFTVPADLKKEK